MAWWNRFFLKSAEAPDYEVPFSVYTEHGERGAEVRVRPDGQAYFIALEWVEGTIFRARGGENGPFDSAERAEIAAVNSPWFLKGE